MYFESHAHYDDHRFDKDREKLLTETLPQAGVSHIVNIGADMPSSRISVKLANQYEYIYAAVGVHPHEVKNMTEDDMSELTKMTEQKKVVAIGETGLDYFYEHSPRDVQKYWFERQLELAAKADLPVVIHSRDATQDTFDILQKWRKSISPLLKISQDRVGVVHCFSGSVEIAREYVKMGFFIGIGGIVTYKNAVHTVDVVNDIPLSRILSETDCPYLSPVPNRGKRNDSQNLSFIVEKIAQIKQISIDVVINVTKTNSLYLFSLK